MIVKNYLGFALRPVAIISGYVLLLSAVLFTYFAPLVFFIGASLAFSYKGIIIDTKKKRYKSFTAIAGFIKHGKWSDLNDMDELLINTTVDNYVTYSLSNQSVSVPKKSIKVVMQGEKTSYSIPIAKCKDKTIAIGKARELSKILNLSFKES